MTTAERTGATEERVGDVRGAGRFRPDRVVGTENRSSLSPGRVRRLRRYVRSIAVSADRVRTIEARRASVRTNRRGPARMRDTTRPPGVFFAPPTPRYGSTGW